MIQKRRFFIVCFLFVIEQIVVLLQEDIVTTKALASEIFAAIPPNIPEYISLNGPMQVKD